MDEIQMINQLVKQICKENNIDAKEIKRAEAGYTNITSFVDGKYVVKVINKDTKPEKLEKEILFYKNAKLPFIPKYVASGKINGGDYLIIEKLEGINLYDVWHLFDEKKREEVVKQISEILNKFHKLDKSFLHEKFVQLDWVEKWKKSFKLNIDILKRKGIDASCLEDFLQNRLEKTFKENKPCLIYNDAHFDNFIYNDDKIYLIDFDRVLYCSVDYELTIIGMMVDDPIKFAMEKSLAYVKFDDYTSIMQYLKKYSPDMFDFEFIEDRVFVYKFIYHLGQAYETNDNKKAERLLSEFKKHFNYNK